MVFKGSNNFEDNNYITFIKFIVMYIHKATKVIFLIEVNFLNGLIVMQYDFLQFSYQESFNNL